MSIQTVQERQVIRWVKWQAAGRRTTLFGQIAREAELDITTKCSGLPSCSADCTYRHSRRNNLLLPREKAKMVVRRFVSAGIKRIVISGGGEPLEPEGLENFMYVLALAKQAKLEVELLTNGKFLFPEVIARMLHLLTALRISIPLAQRGYSHLDAVLPNIRAVIEARKSRSLSTVVMASILIRPDSSREEILRSVELLAAVGIDKIRFKPTHFWSSDGKLVLPIAKYEPIVEYIKQIREGNDKVVISKIDRLLSDGESKPAFCYWADFNPFVVGADGENYSCCEQKYRAGYRRTAEEKGAPQAILGGCFSGCKGDLANRHLQRLLDAYRVNGDKAFEDEATKPLVKQAAISLSRTSVLT